jgi:hypothetical protein
LSNRYLLSPELSRHAVVEAELPGSQDSLKSGERDLLPARVLRLPFGDFQYTFPRWFLFAAVFDFAVETRGILIFKTGVPLRYRSNGHRPNFKSKPPRKKRPAFRRWKRGFSGASKHGAAKVFIQIHKRNADRSLQ